MTLISGGIYLLVFDMPVLTRWFLGYCSLMGALRVVGFLRRRSKPAGKD